ncbi:shikimate dehydrogenase family protein [Protaetiibacter larvae]|uniref:Shikimate dehydrogenase n=1 Tax=Protaetiibacter larvae TaxID=2592654 RepID=A0A5C1Y8Q1_9MICO|nr:shikimate dehydrogenase [Protaetiibacter larvae]QEO10136.1 shikimate dehydrogenase [Protaetiibacter larvae]
MAEPPVHRLAVLGSPIAHSRSPQLQLAAYRVLGLPWSYERVEVTEAGLAPFLGGLDASWRGLSLTMPLKRRVPGLVPEVDPVAARTAQANTILLDAGRPVRAFNTDVHGIVAAFAEAGVRSADEATVIGGGATAESAVVALQQLGARVTLAVRDPAKAESTASFRGIRVVPLSEARDALAASRAVVSTIPPRAEFSLEVPALSEEQRLLDVAYDPWPSALGSRWQAAGGGVVHGVRMLLHQAVHQVRIFVGGDPELALPDEDAVIRAMSAAVE